MPFRSEDERNNGASLCAFSRIVRRKSDVDSALWLVLVGICGMRYWESKVGSALNWRHWKELAETMEGQTVEGLRQAD